MKIDTPALVGFLTLILALIAVSQAQPKPQKLTTTTAADTKYGPDGIVETTSDEKFKVVKEVWKDKAGKIREVYSNEILAGEKIETWSFYQAGSYPETEESIVFAEKVGSFSVSRTYIERGVTKSQVNEWVESVETQFAKDGTIPTPWKTIADAQPREPNEANQESKPNEPKKTEPTKEEPKKEETPKKEEPPKTDKTSTGESGGNTASTSPNFTAPGYDVKITFENGLIRLTETTPFGGITVNMPGDVPLGEKFSGSVFLNPGGKTDAERREFLERLKGYDLSFDPVDPYDHVPLKVIAENVGYPNSLSTFTGTIFESTPRRYNLFFDGKSVISTELPNPTAPGPPLTSFTIPTGGQQGSFIILPGPFDGAVSDTDFTKIGGTSVPTIAESHHSRVVWNTSKSIVPTIEVGENGQTGTCPFHNVSVRLSTNAPIHLLRGQTANVTVTFSGLGQLNQDLAYDVINHSPNVIHMTAGGEAQMRMIPASKVVDPTGPQGGTYTDNISITGWTPGAFTITATVRWKDTCNLPLNAMHKQ